ncbi:MAG: hypothetical protein M3Q19_10340 [Pseudomonadota bacterium]|nr:hypothetical protein [Pseudomonadota bacterium]
MTTTRLTSHALLAGHAAVAMLALAAIQAALPAVPQAQWHAAGRTVQPISHSPRRLPASRRSERALTD